MLWELITILDTVKVQNIYINIKEKNGKEPTTEEGCVSIFMLSYIIWSFVGLLTFQWPLFLMLIFISLIPKRNIIIRWIDGVITFMLLLFILLNAYHFHINIWHLIIS